MMGHRGETDAAVRAVEWSGREGREREGFDGLWLLCIRAEGGKEREGGRKEGRKEELRWKEGRKEGRKEGGATLGRGKQPPSFGRAKHIRLCHQLNWIFVLSRLLSSSLANAIRGGGVKSGPGCVISTTWTTAPVGSCRSSSASIVLSRMDGIHGRAGRQSPYILKASVLRAEDRDLYFLVSGPT